MNLRTRHQGFTLVELLVAIGILAMVAVLGWRGLDGIVRARVALTEQLEATRGMQLSFAQIESDCENMADADLLGRRPGLLWDDNRLTLVRKVLVEQATTQLQVVSYRVVDGRLLRRESPGTRDLLQIEQLWQAIVSDAPAENSPSVVLQEGVTAMQVQAWQNRAWRATTGDLDVSSGGANANALEPTGLQVALTLQGVNGPMFKTFLLGGT